MAKKSRKTPSVGPNPLGASTKKLVGNVRFADDDEVFTPERKRICRDLLDGYRQARKAVDGVELSNPDLAREIMSLRQPRNALGAITSEDTTLNGNDLWNYFDTGRLSTPKFRFIDYFINSLDIWDHKLFKATRSSILADIHRERYRDICKALGILSASEEKWGTLQTGYYFSNLRSSITAEAIKSCLRGYNPFGGYIVPVCAKLEQFEESGGYARFFCAHLDEIFNFDPDHPDEGAEIYDITSVSLDNFIDGYYFINSDNYGGRGGYDYFDIILMARILHGDTYKPYIRFPQFSYPIVKLNPEEKGSRTFLLSMDDARLHPYQDDTDIRRNLFEFYFFDAAKPNEHEQSILERGVQKSKYKISQELMKQIINKLDEFADLGVL